MKISSLLSSKQLYVLLSALVLIAGMVYVVFRLGPLAPVKITTIRVENKTLTHSIFGIGVLEAQQTWLLGPLSASRVLQVDAKVGQHVKAGQLLAEMDPLDLDQRLASQEAALAKAFSYLDNAQAQNEDAQSRQSVATLNLARQKELARQNFISQGALEIREQELISTHAALKITKANLASAAQDIQKIQADKQAALLQRNSMRLVAPADAVVISRDAEAGSTVVAGQAVLRLAQPTSLWVKMRVDQGRSQGLAIGLPAQIVLRSNPHQTLNGKVVRVEWQSDAVTEERIAQVAFDQLPPNLSMGEMAEVTLSLKPSTPALSVPQASVQQYQGRTGVWKVDGKQLTFCDVIWGAYSHDGWVEVVSGLKQGDEVLVYSEKTIKATTRFQIVDALIKKPQS
ncbi:MAG: efflux RND transporter periplasmic adaptor subunit [Limnohabitans sp.]|jgi:HlyD family secretion protein